VGALAAHAWGGAVDANGFELKGARLVGGSVLGAAEVLSNGGLGCQGDLDVLGDGSVGGTLVVGGTVMGSGPYVDSSDARLKQDVRDLFDDDAHHRTPTFTAALTADVADLTGRSNGQRRRLKLESAAVEAVRALRPVRYVFNASAAPARSFPRGDEVGFLAQEVEAVLPELVSTAPDGFKGLAYARFTPVLASAVQALAHHADALALQVHALETRAERRDAAADAAANAAASADAAADARDAQQARLDAAEANAAASAAIVEALSKRLEKMEAAMETLLLSRHAGAA
jgi:hypothetical protein